MYKVLIIEDDSHLQAGYRAICENEGWEVRIASNGLVALEMIKHYKPDVLLLDILMPEMTGLQFLKKYNYNERKEKPVIIVLTNSIVPDDAESVSKELGAREYVYKINTSNSELIEIVKKHLESKK